MGVKFCCKDKNPDGGSDCSDNEEANNVKPKNLNRFNKLLSSSDIGLAYNEQCKQSSGTENASFFNRCNFDLDGMNSTLILNVEENDYSSNTSILGTSIGDLNLQILISENRFKNQKSILEIYFNELEYFLSIKSLELFGLNIKLGLIIETRDSANNQLNSIILMPLEEEDKEGSETGNTGVTDYTKSTNSGDIKVKGLRTGKKNSVEIVKMENILDNNKYSSNAYMSNKNKIGTATKDLEYKAYHSFKQSFKLILNDKNSKSTVNIKLVNFGNGKDKPYVLIGAGKLCINSLIQLKASELSEPLSKKLMTLSTWDYCSVALLSMSYSLHKEIEYHEQANIKELIKMSQNESTLVYEKQFRPESASLEDVPHSIIDELFFQSQQSTSNAKTTDSRTTNKDQSLQIVNHLPHINTLISATLGPFKKYDLNSLTMGELFSKSRQLKIPEQSLLIYEVLRVLLNISQSSRDISSINRFLDIIIKDSKLQDLFNSIDHKFNHNPMICSLYFRFITEILRLVNSDKALLDSLKPILSNKHLLSKCTENLNLLSSVFQKCKSMIPQIKEYYEDHLHSCFLLVLQLIRSSQKKTRKITSQAYVNSLYFYSNVPMIFKLIDSQGSKSTTQCYAIKILKMITVNIVNYCLSKTENMATNSALPGKLNLLNQSTGYEKSDYNSALNDFRVSFIDANNGFLLYRTASLMKSLNYFPELYSYCLDIISHILKNASINQIKAVLEAIPFEALFENYQPYRLNIKGYFKEISISYHTIYLSIALGFSNANQYDIVGPFIWSEFTAIYNKHESKSSRFRQFIIKKASNHLYQYIILKLAFLIVHNDKSSLTTICQEAVFVQDLLQYLLYFQDINLVRSKFSSLISSDSSVDKDNLKKSLCCCVEFLNIAIKQEDSRQDISAAIVNAGIESIYELPSILSNIVSTIEGLGLSSLDLKVEVNKAIKANEIILNEKNL